MYKFKAFLKSFCCCFSKCYRRRTSFY